MKGKTGHKQMHMAVNGLKRIENIFRMFQELIEVNRCIIMNNILVDACLPKNVFTFNINVSSLFKWG